LYDDARYTNNMIKAISCLSKYLTPESRFILVNTCIRGLQKKREKNSDQTYRKGVAYELAQMIGVEKNTVLRWMAHGIQGSNKNIFKLIMISLDHAKDETLKVLEDGLIEHNNAFFILKTEIENDVTFDYL
jgi:hypothetical protein